MHEGLKSIVNEIEDFIAVRPYIWWRAHVKSSALYTKIRYLAIRMWEKETASLI